MQGKDVPPDRHCSHPKLAQILCNPPMVLLQQQCSLSVWTPNFQKCPRSSNGSCTACRSQTIKALFSTRYRNVCQNGLTNTSLTPPASLRTLGLACLYPLIVSFLYNASDAPHRASESMISVFRIRTVSFSSCCAPCRSWGLRLGIILLAVEGAL